MKNLIFLLLIITACLSCKKKKLPPAGEDYLLIKGFNFYVVDSLTNKNLVGKNGEKYHPDSIKIYQLDGDRTTGTMSLDSLKNYRGGIIYLGLLIPNQDYIKPLLYETKVYVYLNYLDTDTFFISKQPQTGFSYYLNNRFLITTPPVNQNFQLFYLKK